MNVAERYILIVEDNPQDEEIAVRVLTKRNVANRIEVARDGEEAVEFLFGGGKSGKAPAAFLPQVVLLDLKLPKLDGMEVLRLIRTTERTKRVPVVIVTSSDEDRDIAESYELGVNSYVRKPVNFDAFSEAVAQIGLYWYVLNTAPKTG